MYPHIPSPVTVSDEHMPRDSLFTAFYFILLNDSYSGILILGEYRRSEGELCVCLRYGEPGYCHETANDGCHGQHFDSVPPSLPAISLLWTGLANWQLALVRGKWHETEVSQTTPTNPLGPYKNQNDVYAHAAHMKILRIQSGSFTKVWFLKNYYYFAI